MKILSLLPAILGALASSLAVAVCAQETPARIRFRFAPPDGTAFVQSFRLERERTIEGQAPARDEAVSELRGVFRKTAEGYEFTAKSLSSSVRRNGQPVKDPVLALLEKIESTYVLATDGEALAIRGFSQIESIVRSSLPPKVAEVVAPMLAESVLVAQEKAEWNARYSDFAEGEVALGEVIDAKEPYRLPDGSTIEHRVRTSFPRWENCPAGRCIRIEQTFDSDDAALEALIKDIAAGTRTGLTGSGPEIPAAGQPASPVRVTGALSRLVDPNTMLIYAERVSRTLYVPFEVPGKGRTASVQREERVYTYKYD